MGVRSDYALDLQLEQVREQAAGQDVKQAVDSVLRHMRSGLGGHRKGGQTLLQLLAAARGCAAAADEWSTVRLLQDSIDYSEERILQPDFEERYRLFQDGVRNEGLRKHVAAQLEINCRHVANDGREFLREHPEATAEQLLTRIESLAVDMRYLVAPEDRPGRYIALRGRAERVVWLQRALQERVEIEDPEHAASSIVASPEALALLAADRDGQMVIRAAELHRRSIALADLRKVTEDRGASELDLQQALTDLHWIFGGQFVGAAARRRLVAGDEIDIPLIRGDGALHVVELKRAMSMKGPLVKRHRGAWVPASEVHDAVGQAVNYLVGLDENRERIYEEFGIETRRASAIVLIGHPAAQPEATEREINEALRTFNTHVNRVEVLTYKELVDNAERSLGIQPLQGS